MDESALPRVNEPVTLLVQSRGVPVSDISRVVRVDGGGLHIARTAATRGISIADGELATVLFLRGGRLRRWEVRVEELLPSTWILASLKPPGQGERREFVRADVTMQVRLRSHPDGVWRQVAASVDLSASGFRVEALVPPLNCELLDVELRSTEGGAPVQATARVVRATPREDGGCNLACAFVSLDSASEVRVSELVFAVREAGLRARLGS